jgi:hypothetical protein
MQHVLADLIPRRSHREASDNLVMEEFSLSGFKRISKPCSDDDTNRPRNVHHRQNAQRRTTELMPSALEWMEACSSFRFYCRSPPSGCHRWVASRRDRVGPLQKRKVVQGTAGLKYYIPCRRLTVYGCTLLCRVNHACPLPAEFRNVLFSRLRDDDDHDDA